MIHPLSIAAVTGVVATFRPLRKIVISSETFKMSSRKCEMKMMLRPPRLSLIRTSNSRSISGGDKAEVGSSRMMMRAPENSTRDSSTSCCTPIGKSPSRARGSMSSPRLLSCSLAWRAMKRQATMPKRLTGCTPRNTFSATVSSGATRKLLVHHADAGGEGIARASGNALAVHRRAFRPHSRHARRL